MKVPHLQRFELTLDIFKGCKHSCNGCMVDKDTGSSLDNLGEILELCRGLISDGFIAYDLSLGPTDIMSSTNVEEAFVEPALREIVKLFRAFTINAALLETKTEPYLELCKLIDYIAPSIPVRVLVPASPKHFKSPKFGQGVSARLDIIANNLVETKLHEAGFVINCTTETLYEGFEKDLLAGFDIEFSIEKDDVVNIPYGRALNKDILLGEKILTVSRKLHGFYTELNDEEIKSNDLLYKTGTTLNLIYIGSKLYWMPFLKDECAFIDDFFEIPKPWTVENVLRSRDFTIASSLAHVKSTQCEDCHLLGSCVDKGITVLMESLSVKDCLVGL